MPQSKSGETLIEERYLLDASGKSCSSGGTLSSACISVRGSINDSPRLANWSDVWEVAKTIAKQGVGTIATSRK